MTLSEKLRLETLIETTLSRVLDHWKNREFVIIASDRRDRTKAENYAKRGELLRDIKNLGYGYVPVDGVGQEDGPDGKVSPSVELSFLVPNMRVSSASNPSSSSSAEPRKPSGEFLEEMLSLARSPKYEQWGITWARGDGTGAILKSDGSIDTSFTDFRVGISTFYTRLKGRGHRAFYLEQLRLTPRAMTLLEARSRYSKGELYASYGA